MLKSARLSLSVHQGQNAENPEVAAAVLFIHRVFAFCAPLLFLCSLGALFVELSITFSMMVMRELPKKFCFDGDRFPDFSSPNCDCFVPQYFVGFWTAPLIWASLITGLFMRCRTGYNSLRLFLLSLLLPILLCILLLIVHSVGVARLTPHLSTCNAGLNNCKKADLFQPLFCDECFKRCESDHQALQDHQITGICSGLGGLISSIVMLVFLWPKVKVMNL